MISNKWIFFSKVSLCFAAALVFLLVSIIMSLLEINKSTKAIETELSDIEELDKGNIFEDIFKGHSS